MSANKPLSPLKLKCRLIYNRIYGALSGVVFKFKLAKAKRHYGGAKNIPPKALGELLGPVSDDFVHLIKTVSEIDTICNQHHIEATQTALGFSYSLLMNDRLDDPERYQQLTDLMRLTYRRQALLDELLALGDLQPHQVQYYMTDEFQCWLNEPSRSTTPRP